MTKYYGRVGGYANSEANVTVFMEDTPIHIHEFVHILMNGVKHDNHILEEGIATLFGGLNPYQSYHDGRALLKNCFASNSCIIEDLLHNRKDLALNYTFRATICEYIMNKQGKKRLFDLYYDENINDKNLIDFVCAEMKITEQEFLADIKKMIEKYDQ